MKAYVLEYKTNGPDPGLINLQYGTQPLPHSKYATRTLAEADCRSLNRSDVYVGSHRCSFSVDTLPGGDFGIICVCHPF